MLRPNVADEKTIEWYKQRKRDKKQKISLDLSGTGKQLSKTMESSKRPDRPQTVAKGRPEKDRRLGFIPNQQTYSIASQSESLSSCSISSRGDKKPRKREKPQQTKESSFKHPKHQATISILRPQSMQKNNITVKTLKT